MVEPIVNCFVCFVELIYEYNIKLNNACSLIDTTWNFDSLNYIT
jgi:hypothetical protein